MFGRTNIRPVKNGLKASMQSYYSDLPHPMTALGSKQKGSLISSTKGDDEENKTRVITGEPVWPSGKALGW